MPGAAVSASIDRILAVVTTIRDGDRAGQTHITVLEAGSLRTINSRAFRSAVSIVARPEGIYTAMPGKLFLLDPRTLNTVKALTVDSDRQQQVGAQLGADPRSRILYVGVPCACNGQPVVDIVDLHRWVIIARPHVPAVFDAVPQGIDDDAWLTYATGMMAAIQRVSPAGQTLAMIGGVGTNSTTSVVTGTRLWTFNATSGTTITCRDLDSGRAEAHTAIHGDATGFGADTKHVDVAIASFLRVYEPSGRCAR